MKKSIAILYLILGTSAVYADSIVTILNPSRSVVSEKEQIIECKVEETSISSFLLIVEPFLKKDDNSVLRHTVRSRDGLISEKITLFAGLNLVHILSSNNNELAVLPILFTPQGQNPLNGSGNWGEKSNILFTSPAGAVTHSNPFSVQGASTDPDIKSIDIVALDASDLLSYGNAQRIEYQRAYINRQKFSFSVPVTEGLNILLAKPHETACSSDAVQIRSIIYDKTNPHITIDETKPISDILIISGKTTRSARGGVTAVILALAERNETPGKISKIELVNQAVPLQKDGSFKLEIPWKTLKEKYTIKAFPIIYVYSGHSYATKTITK